MQGTLGTVQPWAPNFAPRNWLFCDGNLLPIAQNTALFSLLGTIYGGDGRTTFGLPDLRGRVVIGEGAGPGLSNYRLGQKAGTDQVLINSIQMPAHSHPLSFAPSFGAQTGNADQHPPSAAGQPATPTVQGNPGLPLYAPADNTASLAGPVVTGDLVLNNAGGSQTHTNLQPHLALHHIICIAGAFPSRS